MLTQWVTVISWQNGKATVSYNSQTPCGNCGEQTGCGSRLLNSLITKPNPLLTLPCTRPLAAGQQVQLAISEHSLLISAMLVYLLPLAGLLPLAILFQTLFASDIAALSGAICGGAGGFLLARLCWQKLRHRQGWQPHIISINPAPPSTTHTNHNP